MAVFSGLSCSGADRPAQRFLIISAHADLSFMSGLDLNIWSRIFIHSPMKAQMSQNLLYRFQVSVSRLSTNTSNQLYVFILGGGPRASIMASRYKCLNYGRFQIDRLPL